MNRKEFLDVLKNESMLAAARADGAKRAYAAEAMSQAAIELSRLGIMQGDRVIFRTPSEDIKYCYEEIRFHQSKGVVLIGRIVLKSGKCAAGTEPICEFDRISDVRKQAEEE